MVTTGLTLACLTGLGFYLIYKKLPRRVRKFMQKHVLFTDTITCLLTYLLFGGTLVALFAAAWMGVIVSILLALTSNPATNAMMERFGQKVKEVKDYFMNWVTSQLPQAEETEKKEAVPLKEAA